MNIHEGARRIKSIGQYMLFASLGVFAALLCLLIVALVWPALGFNFAIVDLILLPLLVAVPGAVLWGAGWIMEGFAKEAH
jgi:hypothetical protein